jgi:hypothetical protein
MEEDTIMKTRTLAAATAALLSLTTSLVAVAASTGSTAPGTPAASAGVDVVGVKNFDVFVDLQTGFAFVKTPDRWTFVRKLDAEQLKNLPPSTLTALAQDTDGAGQVGIRYAAAPATEQSVGS